MRRLFLLLLLLGLAAATDYYPHAVGMVWRYTSGEVQTITGIRTLGGVEVFELEHRYPGGGRMVEAMSYADGVRLLAVRTGGRLLVYDPPLLLFPPPPLKKGQSWAQETRLNGQRLNVRYQVLGVEGVRVPLGAYNAFKIRSLMVGPSGSENEVILYFVPGLGVVRYATPEGGVIDLEAVQRP